MYLSFELWNHILYFLDTKELYNISLTNKFFNQLSREIIEKRFKKFKNKYIQESINTWKEYVLMDKLNHTFYREFVGASKSMRKTILSKVISKKNLLNIEMVLNKICNLNKRIFIELDSKLIVFLLREWNLDTDYQIKKMIVDHRIPFKERINNLEKYNIFYLNCYYENIIKILDKETIKLIKMLP